MQWVGTWDEWIRGFTGKRIDEERIYVRLQGEGHDFGTKCSFGSRLKSYDNIYQNKSTSQATG